MTQSLYELYGDAITPTPHLSLPEEYTAEGVLGVLGSTLWLLLLSTRFTGPPYESYTGAWGPPYESSAGPDLKFLFAFWKLEPGEKIKLILVLTSWGTVGINVGGTRTD